MAISGHSNIRFQMSFFNLVTYTDIRANVKSNATFLFGCMTYFGNYFYDMISKITHFVDE